MKYSVSLFLALSITIPYRVTADLDIYICIYSIP